MAGPEVIVTAAGPDDWTDIAELMGTTGGYAGCWCMFWRQTNTESNASSPAQNQAALQRIVESGDPVGVLARRGDDVVGWCQVAPRTQFHRLFHTRGLRLADDADGKAVWSIVCVFVDRSARGQGIADELVNAAVELARQHGADLVEAYPIAEITRRTSQLSSGTVGLFTRAGFGVPSTAGGRRAVMTLEVNDVAAR